MKIQHIAAVLVVAAIAAAGWFFVSPLFIDEVVDEPLIGATMTKDKVAAMTPAEREVLMSEMMEKAATQGARVDEAMDEVMPETPLVVATGRFRDADVIHKGSGRASLYRLPDGSHVLRLEDFEVTNGPALVVLLAAAADPKNASDVQAGYLKLADLKGNIGNQNYVIPDNVNLGLYRSVVIWCELFDVLFSPATLNVT